MIQILKVSEQFMESEHTDVPRVGLELNLKTIFQKRYENLLWFCPYLRTESRAYLLAYNKSKKKQERKYQRFHSATLISICDPNDPWAHQIILGTDFYFQTHFFK